MKVEIKIGDTIIADKIVQQQHAPCSFHSDKRKNHREQLNMQTSWKPKPIQSLLVTLLLLTLSVATARAESEPNPLDSAATVEAGAVPAAANRMVVWDGEQANVGAGWVNPKTSTILPQSIEAHSGKTALEFKFKGANQWMGMGWNWFKFKTGTNVGTDASAMKNLSFWMKSKGKTGDLQVNLLCNGDVLDTPEEHTVKVRVLKYCPRLLDGQWHEVVIPLADLNQIKSFNPKIISEIHFGFLAGNDTAGSFFIDDIAFDDRAASGSIEFIHPGLLNSRAELDFVKANIKAGAEPWASLFNRLNNSGYGNLNWTPHPLTVVNANGRDADLENEDAKAAYAQALLWYFTDNEAYAKKSAEILDAWSEQLTTHVSTNHQNAVVAAWCGSVFPLAAEILRSSYPQWTTNETKQFSAMLNEAFLPLIFPGNAAINGNWELSMSDALMCIGVFTEDAATFNRGVFLWRKRVPAYFYLTTDGSTPIRPSGTTNLDSDTAIYNYWYKPNHYFDGLCQETRRDYGHHMQMGLASAVNAAEIAYHQGLDLYSENDRRLMDAMEFQAGPLMGKPVPSALFPDGFTASDVLPTWEIAYNHFHNRKGFALPLTETLIRTKVRNSDFTAMCNLTWESLTHAEIDTIATNGAPAR